MPLILFLIVIAFCGLGIAVWYVQKPDNGGGRQDVGDVPRREAEARAERQQKEVDLRRREAAAAKEQAKREQERIEADRAARETAAAREAEEQRQQAEAVRNDPARQALLAYAAASVEIEQKEAAAKAAARYQDAVIGREQQKFNPDDAVVSKATDDAVSASDEANAARRRGLGCLEALEKFDQAHLSDVARALVRDISVDVHYRAAIAGLFKR